MTKREPLFTPAEVSAARAFRSRSTVGELYVLPGSGLTARLRVPSMATMAVKAGHIPNPLSDEAVRLLATGMDDVYAPANGDQTQLVERFRTQMQAIAEIAKIVFVEPKIADNPDYDKGEIALEDVCDVDLIFAYNVTQSRADSLLSFRPGNPESTGNAGPAGATLRDAA